MNQEREYLKRYYKGNLDDALARLKNGEPAQYIVGNTNFYGYEINVNKNVLIPRRETEELVEAVINRLDPFSNPVIADVGTGSGAIAIALSNELNTHVYASDISGEALAVAAQNAVKTGANITFLQGDMLAPFIERKIKIDVLVSNPPYIKEDEEIEEVVRNNEPAIALFAKNEGLEYYEKILKNAKAVLNDKFLIAFEIGLTQAEGVKRLSQKYLGLVNVEIKKDLSGKNRMVFVYNY